MKKILLLSIFIQFRLLSLAQETFPVNGSQDVYPQRYAFTNATIVVSPTQTIDEGTLLVQGHHIEAVGRRLTIPKGYRIIDLKGKFMYPSFIDAFTTYGMPDNPEKPRINRSTPIMESTKRGAYGWNEAIHPEVQAQQHFSVNQEEAEAFKKNGFGTVQSFIRDGIARGSSMVVSLASKPDNEVVLLPEAGAHYAFDKGSAKTLYPRSLMGSIALIRQTYYDAEWYKNQQAEYNISLKEFNRLQVLPQFFETSDVLAVLRAQKIGREFGKQYIIKTAGDAYKRLDNLKTPDTRLIVPLDFPSTYDVEDPMLADKVSLAQLKHWEMAPANPGVLEQAEIPFALTAYDVKASDFWPNLRKAIAHGLSPQRALSALTITPADFLGIADRVGTLEKGKLANFIICSDSLFKAENTLYENWVQGDRYVITDQRAPDLRGVYTTQITGIGPMKLAIGGKLYQYDVSFRRLAGDTALIKAKINQSGDRMSISFNPKSAEGTLRINAYTTSKRPLELRGELVHVDGSVSHWQASYADAYTDTSKKKTTPAVDHKMGTLLYPFMAFGYEQAPQAESILFKNATVWTNETEGILEKADVWIQDGKIKAVGQNLSATGARVINASGKHLTPGIIDEHSHIAATGGINEGSQAVTAEVRIGDVIDSENINIYRQLAGGVTTSHILHGSANPIGGQSQLIKLRWGQDPEGLKFGDSDGFIKFALGENVKQSNWGDAAKTRFPQTRMGVEQVYVDAFTRAKAYQKARAQKGNNIRRDLELDALVEILENKRFITCHSYVQSEINMLMHVADRMGFKVNTLTHILEGYKVADEMAKRGIAGSTFADWWAYKMEVAEAIPYNAFLMHKQGVLTGINSDDAEMARRLNQEAAKMIKYGGFSEEEALKLVTLNPAKMLHIDDRVGSLQVGKDADIVLWSGNPLSIYAKAEQTYVDGVKYWDIEENEIRKQQMIEEKARLIQKSLDSKKKGNPTQQKVAKPEVIYHCETMEEETVE